MLDILRLIDSTCKDYIEIISYPSQEVLPWQSKFGGLPFLPEEIPYPMKPDGTPLHLLAQFNFAEIPQIEPFPKEGLLQFYIADDHSYGLFEEKGKNNNGFKILFIPGLDSKAPQHDLSFLPQPKYFPIEYSKVFALEFEKRPMPITITDFRFYEIYKDILDNKNLSEDFEDFYRKLFDRFGGHKLGGYPYFTQDDPRHRTNGNKDFLLFQMDSDKDFNWGDSGVANFFVAYEKLKALDFSDVLYNWDCC